MLATLNDVYKLANEKKIAIGAFNIVNFEKDRKSTRLNSSH